MSIYLGDPGQKNLGQYRDLNGIILHSGTITVAGDGTTTFNNTVTSTTGLQLSGQFGGNGNNSVTINQYDSGIATAGEGIYYAHDYYSPYYYNPYIPQRGPYYNELVQVQPMTFPQITFPFLNNIMKTQTKYLDNKFQLIAELAGFKKEEVKVKYFNPDKSDKNCGTQPYIQVIAESKDHVLKSDLNDTYKLEQTFYIDKSKNLNFGAVELRFVDGLLVIEVEYEETSKIKELQLQ